MLGELEAISVILTRVRSGDYALPARVRLLESLNERLAGIIEQQLVGMPLTEQERGELVLALFVRRGIIKELLRIDT
jgi:hypothetical protein